MAPLLRILKFQDSNNRVLNLSMVLYNSQEAHFGHSEGISVKAPLMILMSRLGSGPCAAQCLQIHLEQSANQSKFQQLSA